MRNSLIFKLVGAFFLVVIIGVAVISVLISQATQQAFTLYTTRSGQVWAQRIFTRDRYCEELLPLLNELLPRAAWQPAT